MVKKKRFSAKEISKLDFRVECQACGADGIDTGKRKPLEEYRMFETGSKMASDYHDHNFEVREYQCGRGHRMDTIVNRNAIAKRHGGVYDPDKPDS